MSSQKRGFSNQRKGFLQTLSRLLHVLLVCQSRAGEVQECLSAERFLHCHRCKDKGLFLGSTLIKGMYFTIINQLPMLFTPSIIT